MWFWYYLPHTLHQLCWSGPVLPVCVSIGNQSSVANTEACAEGICTIYSKSSCYFLWEWNPSFVKITKPRCLKKLSQGFDYVKREYAGKEPLHSPFPLHLFQKAPIPADDWGYAVLNKPEVLSICGVSPWLGVGWLSCTEDLPKLLGQQSLRARWRSALLFIYDVTRNF